ncbi:hypothetical protein EPHNCH_0908 [Anaplasma phagocytophilum str. NCH-1]|uniref:Uncharacterized protein n=1 Tax=Anaplasma phagocytophilum str. NCH-1 TaxID=1359161 RepID=A0A0F3NEC8_ANAPH|nr:hypothetical protein EPHNCH_0939 [Anaplasma phagocytophilum str. NCH-1]KJV65274.1 hypothetical protein EPHNCH_0908 [Anaplasma phagocytophilum str. NCH-1]
MRSKPRSYSLIFSAIFEKFIVYLSVELTSNTCVLQVVFVIWGRIYRGFP